MSATYGLIRDLLTEKFGVKSELIKPEATMTDLGLDSLATAELVFEIADKLDIEIPDSRASFTTLGEAITLVDELVQTKSV
jgi:acyl carrier protein